MASRRQRTEGRIRLAVVDDHQLLRAGVRTLLEQEPDLEVAAEVAHGNDICELIRRTKVDVLLLDENGGAKLDHRAANRSCFWAE